MTCSINWTSVALGYLAVAVVVIAWSAALAWAGDKEDA